MRSSKHRTVRSKTRSFVVACAAAIPVTATLTPADVLNILPADGQAHTTDGTAWTLTANPSYTLRSYRAGTEEDRGVMEFSLAGIPKGSKLRSVVLSYEIGQYNAAPPNYGAIQFWAYAGNGVPEAADATKLSVDFGTTAPINNFGNFTQTLPAPTIQTLVGTGFSLGIVTKQANEYFADGIYSAKNIFGGAKPTLTVDYAPPINFYVTGKDANVREYTTGGTLVQTIPVPWGGAGSRPINETVRGTAVDERGRLHVFNGTFAPYVSTYNGSSWTHRTAANLNIVNNLSLGSVAAFGSYVFANDQQVAGDLYNGIVRFDTANNTSTRFASGADVGALARGQDGLLYAVTGGVDSNTLKVYNPYTLSLVRTVTLPQDVRGVAVNPAGEIYGARWWDGTVYKFSPAGAVLKSLKLTTFHIDGIDLAPDGTLLVGSAGFGVFATDESLADYTVPVIGSGDTDFVTVKNPTPLPGWKGSGGNWTDATKWVGPVPNAAGAIANFGPVNTDNPTFITINTNVTVGTLNIDGRNGYVFIGPGSITLDATPESGGRAGINIVSGNLYLDRTINLADDATVSFTQSTSLITGGGTRIDVGTHALVWDYDPVASFRITDLLKAGYNHGAWNGTDAFGVLVSSAAAADPTRATTVGYAEASALGITSFRGIPVDPTAILYVYTWVGDANLDGVVNNLDQALISPAGTDWLHGDFNFDGKVTGDDYALFALGAAYGKNPIGTVPEPVSGIFVAVGCGVLARRRLAR